MDMYAPFFLKKSEESLLVESQPIGVQVTSPHIYNLIQRKGVSRIHCKLLLLVKAWHVSMIILVILNADNYLYIKIWKFTVVTMNVYVWFQNW